MQRQAHTVMISNIKIELLRNQFTIHIGYQFTTHTGYQFTIRTGNRFTTTGNHTGKII